MKKSRLLIWAAVLVLCTACYVPVSYTHLSIEELKAISPVFEADVYDAISLKTCVDKRLTIGAPGKEAMEQVIAANRMYLEAQENWD